MTGSDIDWTKQRQSIEALVWQLAATSYGFWGGQSVPFLEEEMRGADAGIGRMGINSYSDGPRETIFSIRGIEAVLRDVSKACGWSL